MSNTLFDWQQDSWQQIMAMRERMPHAFLLYGSEGIGKAQFAEHLAKSLLCESPAEARDTLVATWTGVERLVVVPSPSWLEPL